jgi:hypothetical protein
MTDDAERERAIEAYSKIAEQIEKEDELVNQRLTWGASINGALLALLGLLFKDFLLDESILVNIFGCVIAVFLSVIAWRVCGSTIRGIVDARKQINYIRGVYREWEKEWQPQIEKLHLPRPFFERDVPGGPSTFDGLLRRSGLDTETLGQPSWWGDELFRLMIFLWVFVAIMCIVIVIGRHIMTGSMINFA